MHLLCHESNAHVIPHILQRLAELPPTELRRIVNGPENWNQRDPTPGGIRRMLERLQGHDPEVDIVLQRITRRMQEHY